MNRAIRAGLALSLLAAACSDDGSAGEAFRVDTRGGAPPALVAYDAGDGWSVADPTAPGVYSIPALGPVAILRACDTTSSADIALHYLTPTARRVRELPCPSGLGPGELPVGHPVSLVPATARAYVGGDGSGFGVPLPQDTLYAPPGRHDVIATTDTRILVRRGISFPPAEPLVLDVAADGSDLVPLALDAPAVDVDESLAGYYSLVTPSGTAVVIERSLGDGLRRAPDDVLITGDRHRVVLVADRDDAFRSVTVTSDQPTELGGALPPRLDEATASSDGDRLTVAWDRAPIGEHDLILFGSDALWWVVASEDWLDDTRQGTAGRWSSPLLHALPGWNAGWDATGASAWHLAIRTTEAAGDTVVETVTERAGDLPAAR